MYWRTTGAWGSGLGVNLTGAQVDENFYELQQAIDAIPAGATGVGIASVSFSGQSLSVTLTDATVFGPFTLPTVSPSDAQVLEFTATTHNPVLTDARAYLRSTAATAVNVIVPANADVEFPIGTELHYRQAGAGQITVSGDTGVTVNEQYGCTLVTPGEGASFTLKKVDEDEWDAMGTFEAV
jgi:hypothetical protein